MSLNNFVKASDNFKCFKRLSEQYTTLSQEIEGMGEDIEKQKYVILLMKYDNLIQDCAFEDIPAKYKNEVSKVYTQANRNIPIQNNGTTCIGNVLKRNSKEINDNIM
jgi:GTPase involved in cell partitioning and DNA repair